jgi:hypothetical protein
MRHVFRKRWYFFIPLFVLAIFGFGYITMLLWNALLPHLFHFPLINFWEAAGLLILTRLLFSGCGSHHRGMHHQHFNNNMREKWMNMSPEEREKFFKQRFHRNFWVCNDSNNKCNESSSSPNE